ncbi:amidohydrolase family protein [Rhodococcus erythropolis]|uniref:amidohydrolase family protein n=1 Tax=Rhodococcus erythropolis TaxID=1833 RepID=UPI00294A76C0|nr:amidohydrolase family protein [Rhodococcus erythropolis]MDV6278095.1 amidohydrolase family protein [Rhodococcus erythropolis]
MSEVLSANGYRKVFDDDGGMVVVRAGRIFDGETVRSGPAMVITCGGVVTAVDVSGAAAPAEALVHDFGPSSTVLPGLIDAHTHLVLDPDGDAPSQLTTDSDQVVLARIRANAARALAAGVTTVRDLGDRGFLTLDVRDHSSVSGAVMVPHIVAAGPPITRPRGHCWFLGGEADGAGAAAAMIADHADRGVDVIKVMATAGMGADPALAQFDRTELTLMVAAAQAVELPVVVHAHAAHTIADAVAAGVAGIEHCTFVTAKGVRRDDRTVDAMARAGVFVGCTVAKPRPDMPAAVLATLEPYWTNQAYMHARGVPVVCCTDAGINPAKTHDVLPRDLAYFASHVATTRESLVSATSLAATACNLGHRKGRIRVGMDADLLVVSGDPTVDIDALTRVQAVYRMGRRVPAPAPVEAAG